MKPLDLIASAKILVASSRGKPSQVSLRRATSSAYYALFHCLARNCADALLGGASADRSDQAWRQTYRALNHGDAKTACANQSMIGRFPDEIRDFANRFVYLQDRRHLADYDPLIRFGKSQVVADIKAAEQVIKAFQQASLKDRRAFAAHVLFRKRPG